MTDDVKARLEMLLPGSSAIAAVIVREGMAEIDRLRAELSSMTIQRDTARLTSMNWESGFSEQEARAGAADALIAEALGRAERVAGYMLDQVYRDVLAILRRGSRGSQGAAEPSGYVAMKAKGGAFEGAEPSDQAMVKQPPDEPEARPYRCLRDPACAWPEGHSARCAESNRRREQFDAEQESNRG